MKFLRTYLAPDDGGAAGGEPGNGEPGTPENAGGSGNPTTGVNLDGSGGPAGGGEPNPNDFMSGLSDDHKTLIKNKGWGEEPGEVLNKALTSYGELQKAFSSRDSSSSAPKDASEYTFNEPTDLPEGLPYDKSFADWFRGAAHAAGLPADKASAVHDAFVKHAAESFAGTTDAQQTQLKDAIRDTEKSLVEDWGQQENPSFKHALEMSRRAVEQMGFTPELLAQMGVVAEVNGEQKIVNADFFKIMAKQGTQHYAEDSLFGSTKNAGTNPFDPATADVTMQGRIYKEDPEHAKRLIMALKPADQQRYSYLLNQVGS